jgi:predicted Zn-dependent protease
MRRLIAILIASLLASGCATSTNPGAVGVTRSQLLMVPSAAINERSATAYTQLSREMSTAGRLNSDPVLAARVKGISERLIQQVGAFRPDARSWAWEVNVIQSDKLNATCMPGGKIVVYSGLVTRLDLTDPEIAAVVGHEIAHALREHSREKVSQDVLAASIVQGIANSGSRYAGSTALLTGLGAQLFVQLPYSREMESESDSIGLELMARAGYDPSLAAGFWVKMNAQSQGGGSTDFFSTHPGNDKRVANLQALAPRVLPLYQSAGLKTQQPSGALAAAAVAPAKSLGLAQQPAPSATETAALVASSPSGPRTASKTLGKDSYQIERSLAGHSCNDAPVAYFVEKGPGYESYEVACKAGPPLRFRCEYGNCVAVN